MSVVYFSRVTQDHLEWSIQCTVTSIHLAKRGKAGGIGAGMEGEGRKRNHWSNLPE